MTPGFVGRHGNHFKPPHPFSIDFLLTNVRVMTIDTCTMYRDSNEKIFLMYRQNKFSYIQTFMKMSGVITGCFWRCLGVY